VRATVPKPQAWVSGAARAARGRTGQGDTPAFLSTTGRRVQSLGIVYVTVDGDHYGAGAYRTPFSVQSVSKLIALALVSAQDGEAVWSRVGYTGVLGRHDSLGVLEDPGTAPNPFVNAGSLLITDRLHSLSGGAADALLEFVRAESGNPAVRIDRRVREAEAGQSHRNLALAVTLGGAGLLDNPAQVVLHEYLGQCAVTASCLDLARAVLFLARSGVGSDGQRVVGAGDARRINGLLALSGLYAGSAEFSFRVGLPSKSGIGGGIVAVIPHQGVLCAWSPGIDHHGTSIAAAEALRWFVELSQLSVY
jgi:glutaminase